MHLVEFVDLSSSVAFSLCAEHMTMKISLDLFSLCYTYAMYLVNQLTLTEIF